MLYGYKDSDNFAIIAIFQRKCVAIISEMTTLLLQIVVYVTK